jgi:hypothetical protein
MPTSQHVPNTSRARARLRIRLKGWPKPERYVEGIVGSSEELQESVCDDNLLQSYRYANASICTVWYHEENMNECPMTNDRC